MRKRNILVHMHLFKNAGTTFDSLLARNFRDEFLDHRHDTEFDDIGGLYNFLRDENNSLLALSSHNLNRDKIQYAKDNSLNIFAVAFVRHPIERIVSVYRFEKQQISNTPGAIAAKKYNEIDYLKWRIDERPQVISNFHARRLGSTDSFHSLINRLDTFDFIGLVDRFEKDVSRLIQKSKGKINFQIEEIVSKNVLDKSGKSVEQKCVEFRSRIGDNLYNELFQMNTLDLLLYDYLEGV